MQAKANEVMYHHLDSRRFSFRSHVASKFVPAASISLFASMLLVRSSRRPLSVPRPLVADVCIFTSLVILVTWPDVLQCAWNTRGMGLETV